MVETMDQTKSCRLEQAAEMIKNCEFDCDAIPVDHKLWFCSALCWRLDSSIGMTVDVDPDRAFEYDELWRVCGKEDSECGYESEGVECECGYVTEGVAQDSSGQYGGGLMVKFPHLKDALFVHHLDVEALTDKDGTVYQLR